MKIQALIISSSLLVMSTACGGGKGTDSQNAAEAADSVTTAAMPALEGQWLIENIVVNDSLSARPADIDPEIRQYITFNADSTFGISTSCNMLGGQYIVHGDSLHFDYITRTEMACENMEVEELLVKVLPEIVKTYCVNNTVVRLTTTAPGQYIELLKTTEPMKASK